VTVVSAAAPVGEQRVDVRWQDLDPLGHVGHDVYLAYLGTARDALLSAHGISSDCYVVASVTVNYRREIRMGTPFVRGRCLVASVGRTSLLTQEQLLAPDGTPLADAQVVVVLWDPEARRSRPVTDAERAGFDCAGSECANAGAAAPGVVED
jgi:acyl-CoA thioester hydrolase